MLNFKLHLQIVYSKSGKVGTETKTSPVAQTAAPKAASKQVEDDDDLDIDAI